VKLLTASLHHGAEVSCYYALTRFGVYVVLRSDLTPYPAYLSLAAVGRLLAGAQCLGRLEGEAPAVRAHLFRARPDGKERIVLVGWTREGASRVALPVRALEVFDHLGRETGIDPSVPTLGVDPAFFVLPADCAERFAVDAVPEAPGWCEGQPCPAVMQVELPRERVVWPKWPKGPTSAYRVASPGSDEIPIYAYNFGAETLRGRLSVTAPGGWAVDVPDAVRIDPGERVRLPCRIDLGEAVRSEPGTIRILGDFAAAGKSVLSFRLLAE
jgi:hypothetical protein